MKIDLNADCLASWQAKFFLSNLFSYQFMQLHKL